MPCRKHAHIRDCSDCNFRAFPYSKCEAHVEETRGCQDCGILFRRHQRKGIAWMYVMRQSLLADSVGTGKTAQLNGLTALRMLRGEAGLNARTVVVCRNQAIGQWVNQIHRMMPGVTVIAATGTVSERIAKYTQPWEILVVSGGQMLINDFEKIMSFPVKHIQVDDTDALRNHENKVAQVIKMIARECDTAEITTASALQKRLHELYSVCEPIGSFDIFGTRSAFDTRYIRKEPVYKWTPRGRKIIAQKVVGYKNLTEFNEKFHPLALRRTAEDIDDVDLPTIIPNTVYLEMYPAQAHEYKLLKKGVADLIKAEGKKVSQVTAMGKLHQGARICAGLAAIGQEDGPETSRKFDWIMDKLEDGDLGDEKVVIFINYKDTIRNIAIPRLKAAGIDFELIWGDEPDKDARNKSMDRFWRDPKCRVLIGTTAIEQSLNLQCARHLINVDMILNPQRMTQLAGRIKRDGSAYKHVYVHNLIMENTQEAGYLPLLEKEQALVDAVWNEQSDLFDTMSSLALLELIAA